MAVCPNPTGSTGYGQRHTDAIRCNWGGSPYEDLVKCFEHLENKVDYIDTTRAVALGASYGGYMISRAHSSPTPGSAALTTWQTGSRAMSWGASSRPLCATTAPSRH